MILRSILRFTFAMVVAASTAYAGTVTLDAPATAELTGQAALYGSVVTPFWGHPDGSIPILLPLSNVIDQNQPSATAYMAAFSQGGLAQSFQQTHANISGAGIFLQAGIGTSDLVTISVWDNLNTPTVIATGSATGTAGQWVDVYWTPAAITPATTYYLVFTGNSTLGISGDVGNPYPYGNVFANSGYQPYISYDYTFRTYYETDVSLERQTWADVKSLFN
jgi:hypothetical protein